jgi:3-methyladenine DNA glycosylase AlkD
MTTQTKAATILHELESLGTAQNRKIYARHGVGPNMYGVSYANLYQLRKRIKKDHDLALELWASGNHDARILATMIADPQKLDEATINAWVRDLDSYGLADAIAGLVGQTALARHFMIEWMASNEELTARAGWHLLGIAANQDQTLDDAFFQPYLAQIEREMHTQKNRVREAMNNALIAIGGRNDHLAQEATDVALRIGRVDVDHGETNCKTPYAPDYIAKMRARQSGKTPKADKKAKAA